MALSRQYLLGIIMLCSIVLAAGSDPSRLSVDFSSSLLVTPDAIPSSVLQSMNELLSDMTADGVNNVCSGRLDRHVCSRPFSKQVSLRLPLLNLDVALGNQNPDRCGLCSHSAPAKAAPCSCLAPGNKSRCSCDGMLTGPQYFNPKLYGAELAYVLAVAQNDDNTVTGGINANFNSTMRLINSTLTVAPADQGGEGSHDLELDQSHLDLLTGSQLHLVDDADLEVEDNGGLWLSGSSMINATGQSNIQTQLSHVLLEGGSLISIGKASTWNVTQEFDFTPAQAASVCDTPFTPNPAAEYCFRNKAECKQRFNLLSGPEKQALAMLKYPPALDRWGRQAFDYTDDVVYDDYYDQDYAEPPLRSGACLGSDVCGSTAGSIANGRHRSRSLLADSVPQPAPLPAGAPPAAAVDNDTDSSNTANSIVGSKESADDNDSKDSTAGDDDKTSNTTAVPATAATVIRQNHTHSAGDNDSDSTAHSPNATNTDQDVDTTDSNDTNTDTKDSNDQSANAHHASAQITNATASSNETDTSEGGDDAQGYLTATEINAPDTLDGKGYDPEWGEGPFGETLCDAPPGKAFNYYGLVIRDGSDIRISGNSTWVMYDTSRAFVKDSKITLEDSSTLLLLNSTLV